MNKASCTGFLAPPRKPLSADRWRLFHANTALLRENRQVVNVVGAVNVVEADSLED